MRLFRRGRSAFFQPSRNYIVTWTASIHKDKHVIVRIALAYHFDASFILHSRQVAHEKVLLGNTHVAIVDVERETGGVWRQVDRYGIAIHAAQLVLVLLRSNQRTHRQRSCELIVIPRRHLLQDFQRDRKSTRLNSSH